MKPVIASLTIVIIFFMFRIPYAADSGSEAAEEINKGTVTGRIMLRDGKDVPLAWGQIMFYDITTGPPPIREKYERTPDISENLDEEGRFNVEIPEGRYWIGAIKRLSGDRLGPRQVGDYIFRSLDEEGKLKEYCVEAGKILDIGTFSEAFPLAEKDFVKIPITTGIEGRIVDMGRVPVEDAVVVAFVEPIVGVKPLFVSHKTGKDGKYILPLTEGTYYLRVRNSFAAGPPQPGQIVGYYGDGTPEPLSVKEGQIIKGIDLQVIVFLGRGPSVMTPDDE